jgi:hypothetical protein
VNADAMRVNRDDSLIELPTLSRRVGAFLTDVLVALILSTPLMLMCVDRAFGPGGVEGRPIYWVTYGFFVLYSAAEVLTSRTPGKWLWRIQIIGKNGRSSVQQRLVRSVIKLLPGHLLTIWIGLRLSENPLIMLTLFLPVVGLHDLCARTQIGRVRKKVVYRGFPVIPVTEPHGHLSTAAHATDRAA